MSYFSKVGSLALCLWTLCLSAWAQSSSSNEPFKLGVEQQDIAPQTTPAYPTYPAYPQFGARPAVPPVPKKPLSGGVQHLPLPLQQQVSVALPNEFLGVWQVMGTRQNIEAQGQYQAGIDGIFSVNTANTWQIQGNPQQGYALSTDTGVTTQLVVDKVQGNTAYLRYQHPIKNTVAQEAIVMMLGHTGREFNGLERIAIVKQGEPQPRAKVTYRLMGRRQR